jgi:hypothetical protein
MCRVVARCPAARPTKILSSVLDKRIKYCNNMFYGDNYEMHFQLGLICDFVRIVGFTPPRNFSSSQPPDIPQSRIGIAPPRNR